MVNGGFGPNFQEEAGRPKIPFKKNTAVLVASYILTFQTQWFKQRINESTPWWSNFFQASGQVSSPQKHGCFTDVCLTWFT